MATMLRPELFQHHPNFNKFERMLPPTNTDMGPQPLQVISQMREPFIQCKALTDLSNRIVCNVQSHVPSNFYFTQGDLDFVLYGNTSGSGQNGTMGHALSGLKIGEISHGIDRILSQTASAASQYAFPNWKLSRSVPPYHDLPDDLCICSTMFCGIIHYGVFCRKNGLAKGTRFGPFKGKTVNTSEIKTFDDNSYMWEIFKDGKLSHFVDGRGSTGNWMSYVNCARHVREQNLVVVQKENEIFYDVSKDIAIGSELLVWYGEFYLQFMGIPVTLPSDKDPGKEGDTEEHNAEGYQCEKCHKVFAYKYYRDKHLKYTKCVDQGNRKYPCHMCSRSFEKRDRLRIHILHVHEKHRPHKCAVCGKSFSQSSSLNKHMRVHSGERPYKCVYCNKSFTASSILRTHIRQHSGERPFKCKFCGKVFASHAAHDSHVRRTHARGKANACSVCSQEFAQPYELKLHMKTHSGLLGVSWGPRMQISVD